MSRDLEEARAVAEAILSLSAEQIAALYFQETLRRNLSLTVRRLDKLAAAGGDDAKLGKKALKRLGFEPDA